MSVRRGKLSDIHSPGYWLVLLLGTRCLDVVYDIDCSSSHLVQPSVERNHRKSRYLEDFGVHSQSSSHTDLVACVVQVRAVERQQYCCYCGRF